MKARKRVFDLGFYDIVKDVLSSSRFVVTVRSSLYDCELFYDLNEFDVAFAQFIRHKYYLSKNAHVAFATVSLVRVTDDLFETSVVYESYVRKPGNRS